MFTSKSAFDKQLPVPVHKVCKFVRDREPRATVSQPPSTSARVARCKTRSSAIAEGPRDASCQLKFANCHTTVQKLLYDKS